MGFWNRIFGSKPHQSSPLPSASAPSSLDGASHVNRPLMTPIADQDQVDAKADNVFVSHSSHDKHNVSLIARVLDNAGMKTWVDREAIRGGDKFPERIHDAIQQTDCLILLWSELAARSDWVRKEINIALDAHRRIIPCRLDSTDLPERISDLHAVDLRSDVLGGLTDLLRALGRPGPELSTLREHYREVFARALSFKLGQVDVPEIRIPGLMFRVWGHEMLPWKGYSLMTKAGVIAPSRSYVEKNYGNEPERLFRSFLIEEGWSCSALGNNNRGEMEYRATTLCRNDKKVFAYAFLAEQLGPTEHANDDWSCRICLLDLNHSQFFMAVVEWTRRRLPKDLLVSDDFIVTIQEEPYVLHHEGIELLITASFHCDLRQGDGFRPWFDHLLDMFLAYLESTAHTCSSVGPPPPTFTVQNRETLHRPTQEAYLFKVLANDGHSFYFLYESETNASKSMGYAKVSVTGALGPGTHH